MRIEQRTRIGFISGGVCIVLLLLVSVPRRGMVRSVEPSVVVSTGTVKRGDTLSAVLGREHFDNDLSYRVSQSIKRYIKMNHIRPGDRYEVGRSTVGEFRHFRYQNSPLEYIFVNISTLGYVTSERVAVPTRQEIYGAKGVVKFTLWEAMMDMDVSPEIIVEFSHNIFAWQIDFLTEVRQGDQFRFVWKRTVDENGKIIGEGKILAAAYEGVEVGKHSGVLFNGHYYTPKGESTEKFFLKAPLNYRRISSHFSGRRFHPILRRHRPHLGIDYAAPRGTPVVTVADGKVSFRGRKKGYGKTVIINHANGFKTQYAHFSRYKKGVSPGKRVKQGDVIGYVGSTGLSTGPHLDFRVQKNGKYINFLRQKFPPAKSIPKSAMQDFNAETKPYLEFLDHAPKYPTVIELPVKVASAS